MTEETVELDDPSDPVGSTAPAGRDPYPLRRETRAPASSAPAAPIDLSMERNAHRRNWPRSAAICLAIAVALSGLGFAVTRSIPPSAADPLTTIPPTPRLAGNSLPFDAPAAPPADIEPLTNASNELSRKLSSIEATLAALSAPQAPDMSPVMQRFDKLDAALSELHDQLVQLAAANRPHSAAVAPASKPAPPSAATTAPEPAAAPWVLRAISENEAVIARRDNPGDLKTIHVGDKLDRLGTVQQLDASPARAAVICSHGTITQS